MRLGTARVDGATRAVVVAERSVVPLPFADVGELLGHPTWRDIAESALAGAPDMPADLDLAPVVPRPSKVVCCGHNYAGHIREMGLPVPQHPTLFAKFADTLTGPSDVVTVPDWAEGLDWEAELAAVVGAPLHRATRAEAAAAIAGWTAANDLSVRSWQRHTGQWLPGKSFDRTTSLGPVLVTADELDPGAGLALTCRVNGEVVQRGDTADLVFDAAALLSYISSFTALAPGDVVLTGTPAGVGAAETPPRSLADGDLVEVDLEGVGVLRTPIRIETTRRDANPGPAKEVPHE
ncbi:fumarylacetoacetate hydrolase family protein [Saccharopolyspora sp. NPDC002686]|uniref:fumarylacetoacetate hydrolase family protein n=1 Tax=Saccharopolyspora sp. NPDC002686 TaxID=3154541 RepID=UPI003329CDA4